MNFNSKNSAQNLKKLHSQSQQNYYSTTQANFFKAYAHQIQFVNRLNELINSIQKRKILKVVQEVKVSNRVFRKYLNEKRIVHIKIEDIIAFQQMCEKQNMTTGSLNATTSSELQEFKKSYLSNVGSNFFNKKQSRLSNLNTSCKIFNTQPNNMTMSIQSRQMIKRGFMNLLQKLQTLKKDQFTNQTKYLQSVLTRQCNKLKDYGFDEDAFSMIKKHQRNYNLKMGIVEEIQKQQKINGLYPIIMKNIRQETLAIEKAQKKYQSLVKS